MGSSNKDACVAGRDDYFQQREESMSTFAIIGLTVLWVEAIVVNIWVAVYYKDLLASVVYILYAGSIATAVTLFVMQRYGLI